MTSKLVKAAGAIVLLSTVVSTAAMAQYDSQQKKPGFLSRMLHRHPAGSSQNGTSGRYNQSGRMGSMGRTGSMGGGMMGGGMGSMGRRHMGGMMGGMGSGRIIGNKNTHVYHMAGDMGNMPSPQNRVYFRSEAEARAAGYRMAGSGNGGRMGTMGRMHGHGSMMGNMHGRGSMMGSGR